MDLEARVQQLEDREEIRALVARYGLAVDDRDIDTLGELFTEDGAFVHGDGGVETHGRREVVEFYRDRLRRYGPTFHYPHSHQISFDGNDDARGLVTAHAEVSIGGITHWAGLRYTDAYRREAGGWRFARRYIATLYFMPLAQLPDGLAQAHRRVFPGTDPAATELPDSVPTYRAFYAL